MSAPNADGIAAGDGDGDVDIVTGEYAIGSIAWYENNGASPPAWTKHIIGGANGAINVYLVRGRNACGAGSYGFGTSGNERISAACN